jgi:hypothetical protein
MLVSLLLPNSLHGAVNTCSKVSLYFLQLRILSAIVASPVAVKSMRLRALLYKQGEMLVKIFMKHFFLSADLNPV